MNRPTRRAIERRKRQQKDAEAAQRVWLNYEEDSGVLTTNEYYNVETKPRPQMEGSVMQPVYED